MRVLTALLMFLLGSGCSVEPLLSSAEQPEACLNCDGDDTSGGAEPISPTSPEARPTADQTGIVFSDDIRCGRHVPNPNIVHVGCCKYTNNAAGYCCVTIYQLGVPTWSGCGTSVPTWLP